MKVEWDVVWLWLIVAWFLFMGAFLWGVASTLGGIFAVYILMSLF